MTGLTFDLLPKAVESLFAEIAELKQFIILQQRQPQPTEEDKLLTVQQAAELLQLSVPTVYGLIHKKELPVMKRSKRCYFSKSDLISYIKAGRKATREELEQKATDYLNSRKGGQR